MFVLLIGPSGVGRSTIIRHLIDKDKSFQLVTCYTDRPLRKGEQDRVSITPQQFSDLEKNSMFLAVNHNFTNRYGTSKQAVIDILKQGKIPILDMQLKGVQTLTEYSDILLKIYIRPPSLNHLKERLYKDNRDNKDIRLHEGIKELEMLEKNSFKCTDIDEVVVNDKLADTVNEVLSIIYAKRK